MPSQVLYPIDRNQSGNDNQEHFNGPHKSYSTHDGLRKYVAQLTEYVSVKRCGKQNLNLILRGNINHIQLNLNLFLESVAT